MKLDIGLGLTPTKVIAEVPGTDSPQQSFMASFTRQQLSDFAPH